MLVASFIVMHCSMEKASSTMPSKLANITFDSNDPGRRTGRFRHTCVEYSRSTKNAREFAILINISLDSLAAYRKKVKIVVLESLDDW